MACGAVAGGLLGGAAGPEGVGQYILFWVVSFFSSPHPVSSWAPLGLEQVFPFPPCILSLESGAEKELSTNVWWMTTWNLGIHECFMLSLNLWYSIWVEFWSRTLYLHNHRVYIFMKCMYFQLWYLWFPRKCHLKNNFSSRPSNTSDVPPADCDLDGTL